jgi:exonuclease III
MIILSWNCRGLGNSQTIQTLRRLVRTKKPSLVFLMETKQSRNYMKTVKVKLGFEVVFVVDCIGKSGGLALLWNTESNVIVQNFSRRHINATVYNVNSGIEWKLTGFYGNPKTARRSESWAFLRFLSKSAPFPWLCM